MSIAVKELRIGNWVGFGRKENGDFLIGQVEGLYADLMGGNVRIENYNRTFLAQQLFPIPLTEEWLLKFGLTNVTEELDDEKSFEIQFGRKTFRVVIDNRGLCMVIYQVDIGMNFQELTDVEFVHEFQNLIFALCGEKLKLN